MWNDNVYHMVCLNAILVNHLIVVESSEVK